MLIVVEKKDKRDEYLIKLLQTDGYKVVEFDDLLAQSNSLVYVMSITTLVSEEKARQLNNDSIVFARDASKEIKKIFKEKRIAYYNYNDDEEFVVKNAYITADGMLAHIIQNTDMGLEDTKALVLGYGRVGKAACATLKNNNAHVAVVTSKQEYPFADAGYTIKEYHKYISQFDVIVNTIPELILKGEILDLIDKECFIIDLASLPGGVDFDAAKKKGLKVMHALGIPGRVAPLTAAKYLKESIEKSLI